MDGENLQFKVKKNVDAMEEVERQSTTPFTSVSGPLWRAVMIPSPKSELPFLEELSEEFPHQYDLLLVFHHAIADGFTSVRLCNLLLSLINDVIEGTNIDETVQVGRFGDGAETQRLITEHKTKLDQNPKIKQMVMRDVQKLSDFRPLISEAFPVPDDEKRNTTLHVARQLTREQTSKLLSFFKEEAITLNSGFMAMANLALVDMFKKRGFQQKMFEICSFNAINFRRYWKPEFKEDFGCHFGPLCLVTETPADSFKMFLEYAHDIQTNMNDHKENGRTFDECLFLDVKRGTGYRDMDEFFTNPPEHPQFFYSNTNMGDLNGVFTGEGKHVQVGWLSRHNSFHRYNSTFINALQTFRGRLMIGIDYNARNITTAVATEYVDSVLKMILDIVRQMP